LVGKRSLDWNYVENQTMFGIEGDFASEEWPVNILVGMAASSDEETVKVFGTPVKLEGSTFELYAGGRKYLETGSPFAPYIGGGFSLIDAKISASVGGFEASGSDSSFGIFLNGGGVYRLESFNIGLDIRMLLGTEINVGDSSGDADYTQFTIVLGYGF